jgi:hypothetical protein
MTKKKGRYHPDARVLEMPHNLGLSLEERNQTDEKLR